MVEPRDLIFKPGLIVNQEFFDYPTMQESAKNWLFLSRYRFDTGEFYGRHDGVQLNNLQFGHADRHEGMMFKGLSPKNCLTIAILQKSAGCVCVNNHKMALGDIIILDDSKPYDFHSSHHTVFAIISIRKSLVKTEIPHILTATDKLFEDTEHILSDVIENEWKRATKEPERFKNSDELEKMENNIIKSIQSSISDQTGEVPLLTEGEKIALEVRAFLLNSLEETMTIQNIVEKFNTTDKTLQNSFRSLFGITPKHFMHLLKLNRAHEDLLHTDGKITNVSEISTKWGFTNFGRFARDYKNLFNELPSETLIQSPIQL